MFLGSQTILSFLGLSALVSSLGAAVLAGCGDGGGNGDGTTMGDGDGDGDGDGEAGTEGDSGEPAPSCEGDVGGPYAWVEGGVGLAAQPNGVQLAVAGDGTAMAAWEDLAPPAAIRWGYYDGSGDFGAGDDSLAIPGTEQLRLAGTAEGNFVALWLEGGWKAASSMGNGGWSDAASVGGGGSGPDLDASDFGDAVAVWHQGGGARGNLMDSDGTWGDAQELAGEVDAAAPLQTAMSRNGEWAVAAWGGAGGKLAGAVAEGAAWGTAAELAGEGNWVYEIGVATDCGGGSYVVWSQGEKDEGFQDGTIRIYSARHNGAEWGGPEQIDGGDGIPFGAGNGQGKATPSFAMGTDGDAVVAWVDRANQAVMAVVRDAEAGWGEPAQIGDTGTSGDREVVVGVDRDGNASAIYGFGNGRLHVVRYDGSAWGESETLRSGGGTDFGVLDYADDGTAVLLVELDTGLKPFYLR